MPLSTAYRPDPYQTDPELAALMQQSSQTASPYDVTQTDPYGLSQLFEGDQPLLPLSGVPQPGIPPELQALVGGQGYDPATLAQMRATATEDVANAALPQLSGMRRALGTAGLSQSPAGAAYLSQIGRRTGDQQSAALRDISIKNADVGNQNRRFGLNLAHNYAMENANRLFQAMNENLSQRGQSFRQAQGEAFGMNPYSPGQGTPQQSAWGPALTGAAQAIGGMSQQQKAQTPATKTPDWGELQV